MQRVLRNRGTRVEEFFNFREYLGYHFDDFDYDAAMAEYAEAFEALLPEGLELHGSEIVGDAYDEDVEKMADELNLTEMLESIDLDAILERHHKA